MALMKIEVNFPELLATLSQTRAEAWMEEPVEEEEETDHHFLYHNDEAKLSAEVYIGHDWVEIEVAGEKLHCVKSGTFRSIQADPALFPSIHIHADQGVH